LKSTLASVALIILIARPSLFAGTLSALPEAGLNLLIGFGLVAGVCLSRWRRRAQ
jgi:hypothetical protein